MIVVSNIKKNERVKNANYVGRPNILGNPFILNSEADRNNVCDSYDKFFYDVLLGNQDAIKELGRLLEVVKSSGHLTLVCYCHPKRCHADTIKRYLETKYQPQLF